MQADTLTYDSLGSRPLPKWLTEQKARQATVQTQAVIVREDHSLKISFLATGAFIILAVVILTLYFIRKQKKQIL